MPPLPSLVKKQKIFLLRISIPLWFKRVRVGSTTSIPIIGWGGEIHQIAEVHHHPMYSRPTIDYDVGVIKVSSPFVWSSRVRPIAVAKGSEDNFLDFSQNATVSGWGVTSKYSSYSAWFLKSIDIPLVRRKRCVEVHEQASEGPKITPRMLCAAGNGLGSPCYVSISKNLRVRQYFFFGLSLMSQGKYLSWAHRLWQFHSESSYSYFHNFTKKISTDFYLAACRRK